MADSTYSEEIGKVMDEEVKPQLSDSDQPKPTAVATSSCCSFLNPCMCLFSLVFSVFIPYIDREGCGLAALLHLVNLSLQARAWSGGRGGDHLVLVTINRLCIYVLFASPGADLAFVKGGGEGQRCSYPKV